MRDIKVGSIWVEKSKTVGKYVWRMRYENPVTCKAEKTSITLTSKSKQAGNQALNLMLDKIKKKIEKQSATLDIASEFILFSDIIDIWLEDQVRKIKHSTYATRTRYCNILKKDFKGKAIGDFSPLMIQRYFNKMPYTRKTLVTYFGIFRQIMNFAFRLDFVKVDLMKKVELSVPPITLEDMEKERKKLFSYDELKQIFILMTRPDCRRNALILEFLFLTGLRYGELASLKWEDYDKQAAYIDINSTLDYSVGGVTKKCHTTPKTIASNRKVYLSNRSIEILTYFKSDNTRLLQNGRSFKDYGYIFPSRTGNPVSWRDLGRSFANFGKRAGFDRKFSPHALRHSHITHLVESGADQVAIMERVGHSDPTITTKIYTHTTDEMRSRLVDLIDEN
ncbi:tyrosine-type recombinase/integrase [Lactococcus raffinolactis]|uniref:tyrosine-type recombinase/integrase n=1 Tax=Pseudolactococcus raffinolactis TaxID=1366 RepID=UPI001436B1E3|nr:site-specific integrase [Lactococcus raffinolactis]MDT2765628.1 tyrosine-type recombinase/integrase [Lactococcus raffinolactis]MDT2788790.1 tyrosine-type recombinase/integrase [Lactococcus raffinolactis]QIW51960.1 tyrosine-type recombinase/integrase [Lactococcus raffinolactis]QIW55424.1 site-specific integrase [Lactococcus raffinolactis]